MLVLSVVPVPVTVWVSSPQPLVNASRTMNKIPRITIDAIDF
jgi:hypothetical protein